MIDQGDGDREQKQQQRDNLRQVITFCENKIDCRRAQVLGYFGEVFDKTQCHRTCDNCERNTEVTIVDKTAYALKALKLANEIDDRYTLNGLLDAFRGSGAKKALRYQDCEHFGSGRDLSKCDAERLLQAMVTSQVLRSYNQTNPGGFTTSYIKTGPKWKDLETGKLRITLSSAEEDNVKKTTNKAKAIATTTAKKGGFSGIKRKVAVVQDSEESGDDWIGDLDLDEYDASFISDDEDEDDDEEEGGGFGYETDEQDCYEEEIGSKPHSSPVYNSSTLNTKRPSSDNFTSICQLAPEYQTILHRGDPTAIIKTVELSTKPKPVNNSVVTSNSRKNTVPEITLIKSPLVSSNAPSSGLCYDYLIQWRDRIAQEKKLNAAFVLSNGVLGQIARQLPMDKDELGRIPGMTQEKISKYGSGILSITNRYIL